LHAVDSLEFDNVDGSGDVSRSNSKSEADSLSDNSGAQADTAVITHERRSQVASELECSQQLSARLESRASAGIEGTVAHIDSDPALPTSGPSTDDTARGGSSEKNEDRNDEETELIEGFFEQEEDDEDYRENIDHPFPNSHVLTDSDAQKASRWKLDYIWHLLKMQQKRYPLLMPTYDEAMSAEQRGGQMTWRDVVETYANESEIGPGKLDPDVRPVALLAGGRLTVRLRRYKAAHHAPNGIVRVFGGAGIKDYDARDAYVEGRMRHWRDATRLRQRAGQAGDLGFVEARRDAFLPSNEDAARAHYGAEYDAAEERKRAAAVAAQIRAEGAP
jgi:hypothetical protein